MKQHAIFVSVLVFVVALASSQAHAKCNSGRPLEFADGAAGCALVGTTELTTSWTDSEGRWVRSDMNKGGQVVVRMFKFSVPITKRKLRAWGRAVCRAFKEEVLASVDDRPFPLMVIHLLGPEVKTQLQFHQSPKLYMGRGCLVRQFTWYGA